MNDSFILKHTPNGEPVARGVHVYVKPITDERKLRLAKERFSKKGFDSDEVVPGAMWEVALNVWASYSGEGFDFYEPMPAPVYSRAGVLLRED